MRRWWKGVGRPCLVPNRMRAQPRHRFRYAVTFPIGLRRGYAGMQSLGCCIPCCAGNSAFRRGMHESRLVTFSIARTMVCESCQIVHRHATSLAVRRSLTPAPQLLPVSVAHARYSPYAIPVQRAARASRRPSIGRHIRRTSMSSRTIPETARACVSDVRTSGNGSRRRMSAMARTRICVYRSRRLPEQASGLVEIFRHKFAQGFVVLLSDRRCSAAGVFLAVVQCMPYCMGKHVVAGAQRVAFGQ